MRFERITIDPLRMNGQPCVRDTRLTVTRVLALLSTYVDRDELKRAFPELNDEDIRQVLDYASASMPGQVTELAEW